MGEKAIKIIGFAATLIGLGVNLLTEWVDDKKMDAKIEEKVSEMLSEKEDETPEES